MIEFLRFPLKLTFALIAVLMIGFYLNLEMPRWAMMSASIVAGGTAFFAGGDPYSGALKYRSILRITGTFIGCVAALTIIITAVRAPLIMLLLCCIWTGICVWLSSLIKVENSYALSLAGYTAMIMVMTADASGSSGLMLAPQFAVERCSEIVLGILCAILADIIFLPRSIKEMIDDEVDSLLVAHYRLLRLCITYGDKKKEEVYKAWSTLIRSTMGLSTMYSQLMMESSRWQKANCRLQILNTLSLTMLTQAVETFLIQDSYPKYIPLRYYYLLVEKDVKTVSDVHKRIKVMRRMGRASKNGEIAMLLNNWVSTATEYLLLIKGIKNNSRITMIEESILKREEVVMRAHSAETHYAMINGLRTFVSTTLASLFWFYTGWTSGSACMVMLAVITALAMRVHNPLMMAKDFLYGMTVAVPLGALYFIYVLPNTQQSKMLLCIVIGLLGFMGGIFVQRRQLGTLGALIGTINVLVLDNPMQFEFNVFLNNVLGQVIGCFVAMMVILLVRDKSKVRTGRKLLNHFMYTAISSITNNQAHSRQNHLPVLYQHLLILLNLFPGDIDKYHIALTIIVGHYRLRNSDIPVNAEILAFHRHLQYTAHHVISAYRDDKRSYYFQRLLEDLEVYQKKLLQYEAPLGVIELVKILADILNKYYDTFVHI
ncbi:p-hydroxybenzoic acid efflux pump subunit AaeB [Pantoea sp. Nvir]|uniref:p-hydroxybenzoic acid efflux pump subunit AaeB n=1 Tax=Pantoea sp. Nvir TaxID=2576760 RepID=UPI001358A26F|nr:p-hydroxybenzoic acid efflux pump subunit AaeB [Pantoea sp. Nvir]MXP67084.1 p-hydroxybenzoic acid efflux pump subunit AaeB [Pantoea sp. Nvir]CAJ0990749.1 p-hydroxybenzoic acid efflux pump subunit AaeB [Pantoea sp. Nvir]